MSDYTKATNFTAKDAANDTILGSDFETELGAVQTMSTTKSNKVGAATADNVASLTGTGDLQDSGLDATKVPQLDDVVIFELSAVFTAIVGNGTGGSKTFGWDNGNKQRYTINANATFTFTAPSGAANLVLLVTNSGGARTITWPGTVIWPNGTIPTPSTGVDLYSFFYDGTNYYGMAGMDFS